MNFLVAVHSTDCPREIATSRFKHTMLASSRASRMLTAEGRHSEEVNENDLVSGIYNLQIVSISFNSEKNNILCIFVCFVVFEFNNKC